jgi:hypothetical protein
LSPPTRIHLSSLIITRRKLAPRVVYLADPEISLRRINQNSVERGVVDLLKPWFGLNVTDYKSYVAARPQFLLCGDPQFFSWIVPQLEEDGMQLELKGSEGSTMLFLVSPPGQETGSQSLTTPVSNRLRTIKRILIKVIMIKDSLANDFIKPESDASARAGFFPRWLKSEKAVLIALLVLTLLTWAPRLKGPLDLRWDGGVYYILGTSLAEGRGYKLLNEPGEIDAVQYPPLLPLIIAGHQLILGTNDPTTVGGWLRVSAFLIFIFYIFAVFRLFKNYLSLPYAFVATILCLFCVHVYFLSDLCFPEVPFSLTTILFFLCNRKEDSRAYSIATYFLAVAAYALRTVGLAVFAAWVLESLIKRRFKQAALAADTRSNSHSPAGNFISLRSSRVTNIIIRRILTSANLICFITSATRATFR